MFAGYFRYAYARFLADRLMRLPAPLRRGLAATLRAIPPDSAASPGAFLGLPAAGQKLQRLGAMLAGRREMIYWNLVDQWNDLAALMPGAPPDCPDRSRFQLNAHAPAMEQMQFLDAAGYLPGDILTKVDRASMAVGLEVRVPFLDHTVVEHAGRLPCRYKVRGRAGKWILRRILERYVPAPLFERPKQGFVAPVSGWLRGPLRDWADSLISAERLGSHGLLAPDTVQRLWREHQSRRRDWSARLWAILMFQAWHEHWFG
jgi:asparagine synthase (glutamine-hydrolysing)